MWSFGLIVIVGVLGLIALALALWSRLHPKNQSVAHLTQPFVYMPTVQLK